MKEENKGATRKETYAIRNFLSYKMTKSVKKGNTTFGQEHLPGALLGLHVTIPHPKFRDSPFSPSPGPGGVRSKRSLSLKPC